MKSINMVWKLKKSKAWGIIILIATVLILFALDRVFCIKELFESFAQWLFPNNEDRNGELFKILLSILGAIGILFGLYISLRRAKAMESGVERQKESIDIQTEQIKITRKAQTDERFKNAVEHLGSDKEPIILGGYN